MAIRVVLHRIICLAHQERRCTVNRRYSSLAASFAVLAFAACSESTNTPNPVAPIDATADMRSPEFNTRHIFHTREFYAHNAGATGGNTGILYHGGPLIVTPSVTKVVAIYWGNNGPLYDNAPASGTGAGTGDGSLIG